ncbi:MAG: uroporphyrinogen decarboxylase family protein [Candidatus Zixiibacteriota bacterium]
MEKLSHRDRIQAIITGDKPDRFAASFWRHFYHREHYAQGAAEAMLWFQKKFDWDFVKINPRADYHVEDWGLKQKWSHDELKKHQKTHFPINRLEDWEDIRQLEPTAPVLAEHLKVVSLVRKGAGKDVPVLMTVFTPLAIAGRMVPDRQMLVTYLREAPEIIERTLEVITLTFVKFVEELRNAGADGLFFATTQWASSDMITWEEYRRFGVPFDLQVIKAAGDDALNLFHVCSSNNFLKELSAIDYRSQLYNWDSADPTNLPLDKAYDQLKGKTLVGGVDQRGWLLQSSAGEVGHQIQKIMSTHDSNRVIIGPGCSVPPQAPLENLRAIREALR